MNSPLVAALNRASLDELDRIAAQLSRGHLPSRWRNAQQLRANVLSALDFSPEVDCDYDLADGIVVSELDTDASVDWANAGLLNSIVSRRNAIAHRGAISQPSCSLATGQGVVFEAPLSQAAIFQMPMHASALASDEQFPDSFILVAIPREPKPVPRHFRDALLELILRRADRLFRQQLRVFGGLTRVHEFLLTHFRWHLIHGSHPPDVAASTAISFSA